MSELILKDDQVCSDFENPEWKGTVYLAGRSYGKKVLGAASVLEYIKQYPNSRIGLLAPTLEMGRTDMIECALGILEQCPEHLKPEYNRKSATIKFADGSEIKLFSSEDGGSRVRGENFNYIWADEFNYFKFSAGDDDLWKMAKMALREGKFPKFLITTSGEPVQELKDLSQSSDIRFRYGTALDNTALPASYIAASSEDIKCQQNIHGESIWT